VNEDVYEDILRGAGRVNEDNGQHLWISAVPLRQRVQTDLNLMTGLQTCTSQW